MMNLANRVKVVVLKNGIKYTLSEERANAIQEAMKNPQPGTFFEIDGESISMDSISGVHFPDRVNDMTSEKNGHWKCGQGKWHAKGQQCTCGSRENVTNLPLYTHSGRRDGYLYANIPGHVPDKVHRKFIDGVEQPNTY